MILSLVVLFRLYHGLYYFLYIIECTISLTVLPHHQPQGLDTDFTQSLDDSRKQHKAHVQSTPEVDGSFKDAHDLGNMNNAALSIAIPSSILPWFEVNVETKLSQI